MRKKEGHLSPPVCLIWQETEERLEEEGEV